MRIGALSSQFSAAVPECKLKILQFRHIKPSANKFSFD